MTYRVDLHVHTRRYSPCAELLDPAELAAIGARAGLAGIVITEHDVQWPLAELEALRDSCRASRLRLYRGVEVSALEGHYVVIGLEDSRGIRARMPLSSLAATVEAQGAALILAHPFRGLTLDAAQEVLSLPTAADSALARPSPGASPTPHSPGASTACPSTDDPPDPAVGAAAPEPRLRGVHAVEICNADSARWQEWAAFGLASRHGLPMVAGSDAHSAERVGACYTTFPDLPEDERALALAIRQGLGRPSSALPERAADRAASR